MIEQQAANGLSIGEVCEVLDVSPSAYYAWKQRGISARELADALLGAEVERIFQQSRQT